MSEHLAAEQARARDAHERLVEATVAQAAELERIREEAQARITAAEDERDSAIQRPRPSLVRPGRYRRATRHSPSGRAKMLCVPVFPDRSPSRHGSRCYEEREGLLERSSQGRPR